MRNPQKKKMESIYKVARTVKRRERSLYNALRSIHHDYSMFIREIALLWPELALLANLRCGLWYAPQFDGVCYFKSTDGHNGNWSFSATRLNLHVAFLAGFYFLLLSRFFLSLLVGFSSSGNSVTVSLKP